MFRFVIRKMFNKKWMVLALLIGNILLVSIAASNPMYTRAVLQRTLNNSLNSYMEEKNSWPATMTMRAGGLSTSNSIITTTDADQQLLSEQFGLPVKQQIRYYWLQSSATATNLVRDDIESRSLCIGSLSDLRNHITMVSGTFCSESPDGDGVIDAIVSENCLISMDLIPGEVLTFTRIKDLDGNPVCLRIAGVFENSDPSDLYWVKSPSSYSNVLFIDDVLFCDTFLTDDDRVSVNASWYTLMDYTAIRVENVQAILDTTDELGDYYESVSAHAFINNIETLLTNFKKTEAKVKTTLLVLQVPILVLTAAFIFMVARQMLGMEQGEISVLKSRGAGKGQIISIYLLQSTVTALAALAIGLPLSTLLVKVLGSANAFLEFVSRSALHPEIDREVLIYAGSAALLSVCAMTVPVFRYSDVSIVNQKQRKHRKSDAPMWQRLFLDFVILGVSIYGLYTFNNQRAYLAQTVLEGASLDPLLFLSSSLFMLGAGLVALRILPAIVWIIYRVFRKSWSPALYASFLRVLRTKNQQGFIMVFLIMTIALGIFDASAARTINTHDEQNILYSTGADIVVKEVWNNNQKSVDEGEATSLEYYEPDFNRYMTLDGAESVTKVLSDSTGTVSVTGGTLKNVQIMGIETDDFGRTAWFDASLLPHHWYSYLNAMAQKGNAVLVSTNFKENYGYKIGDVVSYRSNAGTNIYGVIYGFVDYWPSYSPKTYAKGSNGLYSETENYLIVANLSQLQSSWGVTPYQIWIKTEDSTRFMYEFSEQNAVTYSIFKDTSQEIVSMKNDPVIQGTNGVLTVGFIVVLLLCAVGFLIYWILSIRSRELQFGIFRAMGMSMREIVTMLINEQIFISCTSILTGALVGWLTSKLFMPLIQIAYSSSDNALPLRVINLQSDTVRLAILIGSMVLICLIILGSIIRRMKIAQALKLGED